MLVDRNARNRRMTPEFHPESFFGQLQRIFVVRLPATPDLDLVEPTTLILALIRQCDIVAHNSLDMHYYKKLTYTEVVDMGSVQCVVGRIYDRGCWVILDRSGSMACGYYDPTAE